MNRPRSIPMGPGMRNEAGLGCWHIHPSLRCLLTQKNGERTCRCGKLLRFPLKQACRQALGESLPWIQDQELSRAGGSQVLVRRGPGLGIDDSRAVLAANFSSGIARVVIDDQNVVAGIQCLKGSPQAEGVVFGVQQCGDRGHAWAPATRVYAKLLARGEIAGRELVFTGIANV